MSDFELSEDDGRVIIRFDFGGYSTHHGSYGVDEINISEAQAVDLASKLNNILETSGDYREVPRTPEQFVKVLRETLLYMELQVSKWEKAETSHKNTIELRLGMLSYISRLEGLIEGFATAHGLPHFNYA